MTMVMMFINHTPLDCGVQYYVRFLHVIFLSDALRFTRELAVRQSLV